MGSLNNDFLLINCDWQTHDYDLLNLTRNYKILSHYYLRYYLIIMTYRFIYFFKSSSFF